MKEYELMVVFSPQLMSEGGSTPKVAFEKFLKKLKIEIVAEDDWGEKSLEYKIDGYDRGYFVVYTLKMETDPANELSKKIRLEKGLLRWLITLNEDDK